MLRNISLEHLEIGLDAIQKNHGLSFVNSLYFYKAVFKIQGKITYQFSNDIDFIQK